MRTTPVALAYLHDPVALAEAARAVSELTHHDTLAGALASRSWPLLEAFGV